MSQNLIEGPIIVMIRCTWSGGHPAARPGCAAGLSTSFTMPSLPFRQRRPGGLGGP